VFGQLRGHKAVLYDLVEALQDLLLLTRRDRVRWHNLLPDTRGQSRVRAQCQHVYGTRQREVGKPEAGWSCHFSVGCWVCIEIFSILLLYY